MHTMNAFFRLAIIVNVARWLILIISLRHNINQYESSLKKKIMIVHIFLFIATVICILVDVFSVVNEDTNKLIGNWYIHISLMVLGAGVYIILFLFIRSHYLTHLKVTK